MCYLMSCESALKWILDSGEIGPFDDPRYQHAAGCYDCNNHIIVISYCICYRIESIISTNYVIESKDEWPIPMLRCHLVTYTMSNIYPVLHARSFDDPFLPREGWHKLTIDQDRSLICDIKGRPLYRTRQTEQIPKELPDDSWTSTG